MATLYLIRHGQASFGSGNYDRLSPVGWEQGRVLGRWLEGRVLPSAVFSGTLQRHRETVQAMADGFNGRLPAVTSDPGLNEFDHKAVIERWRPAWTDPAVMTEELTRHGRPAKAFHEAFVQAVQCWVDGRSDDYPESWPAFRTRVLESLEAILSGAPGGDLLVVTSGGPIMIVMQYLLELTDARALGLNHVLANAGVTRILFSGGRRSLAVFNSFTHLEAESPELVTYR